MRKIAFTNQKGGGGKDNNDINTGAGLSKIGYKVLLIDMDPQANLTYSLKIHSKKLNRNIYHVLSGKANVEDIVIHHNGFDILQYPSVAISTSPCSPPNTFRGLVNNPA